MITALCWTIASYAQTKELILPKPLNDLRFKETNVKIAKQTIRKPATERQTWSNANLGFMCIRTYYTILSYSNFDCELTFYSGKKNKKNKKILSLIELGPTSTLTINESVKLNVSDTSSIKSIFGTRDDLITGTGKNDTIWLYDLNLKGQQVEVRFTFDVTGILKRIQITFDN